MDITDLVVILPLITIVAVIAFAIGSKVATRKRMEDDSAPKSTLAADAPNR